MLHLCVFLIPSWTDFTRQLSQGVEYFQEERVDSRWFEIRGTDAYLALA